MSTRAAEATASDRPVEGRRVSAALAVELALMLGVFALAVTVRLVAISDPTDLSDEGIRGLQLRLLAAGFRPVSEIYASQGPLSLWLFFPLTALLGPDIVVGRLTVVVSSLVVLSASTWIARLWAGPVAGLATAAVLAVSPVFLENSRLAFVEVPSMTPALLGLVALLQFRTSRHRGWLVASAVLMAVGALTKPMAAVAGLPALVLLLAPCWERSHSDRSASSLEGQRGRAPRRALVDLGLFTLTGAAVCAAVVLAVGPVALYEQMVAYRIGARAQRGWDLLSNADLLADQLIRNGSGVLIAGAVGLITALVARRALGLAVAAWLVGGLVALLAYSPLWPKHVAYLLPPLAILAGAGFSSLPGLFAQPRFPSRFIPGLIAGTALVLVVLQAPSSAAETRSIVYRHAGQDLSRYVDDLAIVGAATQPGDFVVVDDAYLAMLTGRLTPPLLADLSYSRILARALTGEQAISETSRFGSRVLILQDDHLGQIQRYLTWADREYVLVKSYVQERPARFRRVYARRDVDLSAVKTVLRAALAEPTDVRIGPAELLGYELESREIKTGSRVDLTLMFEALQDRPPEHALVTRLRDGAGQSLWESEWKAGEGTQELHRWSAGGWQAQTMRLLVDDIPPGAYRLTIALHRPNRGPAPVTVRSGAAIVRPGGDELDLGEVTVVR